jgi:hypothetical protein
MNWSELAGMLVGFALTVGVFSYVLGDNRLFRLVTHIFIGVSSAFVGWVAWSNVIWPQMVQPLLDGSGVQPVYWVTALVLSLVLATRAIPRLAPLSNPVLAILVGAGAATALVGAVVGTLFSQVTSAAKGLGYPGSGILTGETWINLFNGLVMLVGTVTTLLAFQLARRSGSRQDQGQPRWFEGLTAIGKAFIAVALGAFFAGVLSAALAALIQRLNFIILFFEQIFG